MDINFKKQIEDDIRLIKEQYIYLDDKLSDDEYAFNYWILNKLYNIDEEIIPNYVTDINDKGIDCYVHYEDTKELFLIQNKYYSTGTAVSRNDVSDFLYTPLRVLLKGNYKKSPELQKIFDRAITDSEYKIYLHFYVTNDYSSMDIDTLFDEFQIENEKIQANILVKYNNIDEIRTIYYGDRFTNKKHFTAKLPTRRSGTSLDVRPEEYDLKWMIDLRYVLVNVVDLYSIYKEAVKNNYELFEENIREYLGTQGVNNGIIKTLKSKTDRENFFYYNNGITIICEKCDTLKGTEASGDSKNLYGFKLVNPQIVNGCQTVNSIAEVLSHYSDDRLKVEFDKTFVLVKVFVFDEKTKQTHGQLDVNIVKYTNSQNGINEKAFASKKNYFLNIQTEFKNRGMLLLVKPSDKNKFKTEFEDANKLAQINVKSKNLYDFFDLEYRNISSSMIQLEKMLKVLLAFIQDGHAAFVKGSSVLKPNSPMYKDFSLNIENYLTIDNMVRLFMMYNKAETEKKKNDNRHPIPYYLLSFIGYSFKGKNFNEINEKLDKLFSNKAVFLEVYNFYKTITNLYSKEYSKDKQADYNVMIKQEINMSIFEHCLDIAKQFNYSDSIKWFVES
ncbi:MAG: AIPR family protein [Oscillospiraceae bacterium]